MATNDFIHDLVDKIAEENIEYILVTVQKGKKDSKSMAHYNITTIDGLDMIATTVDQVFENIAKDGDNDLMVDMDDSDSPEVDEKYDTDDDESE